MQFERTNDLDSDALNAITSVIGRDEVECLLKDLLASVEHGLRDMEVALREGNLNAVARAAHRLAGGCGSLGAITIQDCLRQVEWAADAGDRQACKRLMGELPHMALRLRRAVAGRRAPDTVLAG